MRSLLLAAAASCAVAGRPMLSEILYDAAGDDSGHEFVELLNPSEQAWPLLGLRLEVGDGSAPGRWSLRWTGSALDTVPAGGRFVIGGARVIPAPDRVATLDLQNGPDAVRLVWPDGVAETLGYGSLEFPEYACGEPASDAPAGWSLARLPDGADQGGNALDFAPAVPSPGGPNQPRRDLAIVRGSLALAPERPEAGAPARLDARIAAVGAEAVPGGAAALVVLALEAAGEAELARTPIDPAPAPGDTAAAAVPLPPLAGGKHALIARVALPGDERPVNDSDTLRARVGPGPVEVTEIQFHPTQPTGEWIEVRNRSEEPFDLSVLRLGDRTAGKLAAIDGGPLLMAESLAVIAQDPAALLARHAGLDAARVRRATPWPSLNNADGADGYADLVVLREADGTPVERLGYSASGVPAGVPLELRDGVWLPAAEPDGSPLAAPRPFPPLGRPLAIAPRRIGAGRAARVSWSLAWPARLSIAIHDLSGREIGRTALPGVVPRRGERDWAPGGLPAGVYVVLLVAESTDGGARATRAEVVLLEGAAP